MKYRKIENNNSSMQASGKYPAQSLMQWLRHARETGQVISMTAPAEYTGDEVSPAHDCNHNPWDDMHELSGKRADIQQLARKLKGGPEWVPEESPTERAEA